MIITMTKGKPSLYMYLYQMANYALQSKILNEIINIKKQDCLLQGQAQLDQRVVFCFCTLKLRSKKEYF